MWIIRCWISSAAAPRFMNCPAKKSSSVSARPMRAREAKATHVSRPGGTLNQQRLAVVLVEALEGLDEEEVDREPDGTSPVRVAAEHARARVAWPVADAELLAVDVHLPRVLVVIEREPEQASSRRQQ